jgi:hypothetical protein
MKTGVAFLMLIILANLVAAGVIGQLSQITREIAPWTRNEWWPWVIIAAVGIGCALAFLRGAIAMLANPSRMKRKTP